MNQGELLLEIGTEEIPAGFIIPAVKNLQQTLTAKFADLHLEHGSIQTAATPRRLTVCVKNLIARQPDTVEEALGPPKKAAFDKNNQPTKAAIGFAKSRGASIDDLEIVSTPKGEYLLLRVAQKGKTTHEILTSLLPEIILSLPFPKSMRWGSGDFTFARPIHWLVALYDSAVIPFEIAGIHSNSVTQGHRFMATKNKAVTDYDHYLNHLRKAQVIADIEERRGAVIEEIHKAAKTAGGTIIPDEELVDTVTNLVEKPFGVCGTFEERFLALPKDVLITSMREHQKYFTVVDEKGSLMPHFVAVNNTEVKNHTITAEGHQRVLRARLEDALFFFNADQKRTLESHVNDLSGVIFQSKLGTMLEKTNRITKLAEIIAEDLAPVKIAETKRAAHLAKADLLTEMVNEFPSLQGVIGKEYALLNNELPDVAAAIEEHYMPVRSGEKLPQGMPGKIVSMADRIDTIAGCFGIGQVPTGTTDPFGLRRLALGLLHIIADSSLAVSLGGYLEHAMALYEDKITTDKKSAVEAARQFIKGRFTNDLNARGIPLETIEAVTSVAFDDPTDCRLRIKALHEMSNQETFTLLAGSFKRVMNIIKAHATDTVDGVLLTEPAEKKLYECFQAVEEEAMPSLETRNYNKAMVTILKMKEPVDTFFDEVLVMAEDDAIKNNRLSLLAAIAGLFLKIGDFSKMYALGRSN
jgi:glycyl-tRNA synthetase beta chain